MTVTAVIGAQWGDEGKGKVTDVLAEQADYVIRFQGGNNAGHTLVIKGQTHKLHLLPSGILRKEKIAVIGNGLVVDPRVLLRELERLAQATSGRHGKLKLSDRAHLIMPYHLLLDGAEEAVKGQGAAAGTTRRGIGPCYADKAARFGVRVCDLLEPETLRGRLELAVPRAQALLRALGAETAAAELSIDQIEAEYSDLGRKLAPYVCDTSALLGHALAEGRSLLLEGAQGVHLDLDHGVYPFNTSSTTIAGGAASGAGLPPTALEEVVGVVKAYTTRVGTGPFPTELHGELGEQIREQGDEYGTTTGRPRRCGWLDLVMLRYSHRLCGFTGLAVTKLDVLSGLEELKVATAYRGPEGETVTDFPASMSYLERCQPVYESLPGWPLQEADQWEAVVAQGWEGLPGACRAYLEFLEQSLGVKVKLASVGPGRTATIFQAAWPLPS